MNGVFDIAANSLQTTSVYRKVIERTDTSGRSSIKY